MSTSSQFSLKPVLEPQAWQLLNASPAYTEDTADAMNITLRKQGWSQETVAAVLTQLRLRRNARAKFGSFAERMLFTDQGLQQSTRLPVAARHARRFRSAGLAHIADLGCGLGADSLAFASAGLSVTAVEADETTAAAAHMNLRPFPEAHVIHSTAEDFVGRQDFPQDTGVWLDPARRDERARIWDPEEFSPPLSFVMQLAATGVPLGVKLGPGLPHGLIPADCEAEWVSLNGDLVEVVLWFNALARRDADGSLIRRAATVLTTQPESQNDAGLPVVTATELTSTTDFGQGVSLPAAGSDELGGILWEPDAAVIRSGLVAELCEQFGGQMLDEHIAYFCTRDATPVLGSPLARGYRVLEVMPFSAKRLKQWCSERQVTSVEIKKRGVDVIPEQLRQQILPKKAKGRPRKEAHHVTLIITRLGGGESDTERLVAVVEPLS